MEPLARLIVSLVELAEVELATLNKSVIRLGLSLVMVVAAGVIGVAGVALVLIAGFLLLKALVGLMAAFAISGAICLGGAAVLGMLAFKKKAHPAIAPAAVTMPPVGPATPETTDENAASLRIAS